MSDELNDLSDAQLSAAFGSPGSMAEQVSHMIWGSVVTTTKAFGNVEIKIDVNASIVLVKIALRWWAKSKRLEWVRQIWLRRAEIKARPFVPEGWRLLAYYDRGR